MTLCTCIACQRVWCAVALLTCNSFARCPAVALWTLRSGLKSACCYCAEDNKRPGWLADSRAAQGDPLVQCELTDAPSLPCPCLHHCHQCHQHHPGLGSHYRSAPKNPAAAQCRAGSSLSMDLVCAGSPHSQYQAQCAMRGWQPEQPVSSTMCDAHL